MWWCHLLKWGLRHRSRVGRSAENKGCFSGVGLKQHLETPMEMLDRHKDLGKSILKSVFRGYQYRKGIWCHEDSRGHQMKNRKKSEEEIQGPRPWDSSLFRMRRKKSHQKSLQKGSQPSKRKTKQMWCHKSRKKKVFYKERRSLKLWYLKLWRCQVR